jgi:hypothetical protein
MTRAQRAVSVTLAALCLTAQAWSQALPQSKLTYEDRSGAGGHVLVVDGKSFGPYKDVLTAVYSTSGTAAAFAVVKRDRVWVLAQGKESGPLPLGFDIDRLQIADDGKVWLLTATRTSAAEDEPNETLLWVNGKSYGPYPELTTVEYAETGGAWVAAVRTAAEEADVLVSGKAMGPFYTVDHAWLTPDGRSWGYAVSDSDGLATVVTSEKTWTNVKASNFTNLYPREPHWGYSLRVGDEEKIVVDGQSYEGYTNFRGLVLTPSGRHWGFEAEKPSDPEARFVVIDGKEYPGETLAWSRLGSQETYTWIQRDGTKVAVQTLRLP